MESNQKEREALLKSARISYSTKEVPAIHPRYGALYKELYGEEESAKSTLGIRIIISLILFALYAAVDQGYLTEVPVNPNQITYEIEANMNLML